MITTTGLGCGDADPSASECILADGKYPACKFHFVSAGVPGAVNSPVGDAIELAADGTFSGATVRLGTTPRSGCVGRWDAKASTVMVACGGAAGSTQSCEVTLVRTGGTCN
jgi:hypothetical protein